MPKYIITKASNQVEIESVIAINATSLAEAEKKAKEIVAEYNGLGHDHATGWVVKSVVEAVAPPPES
jgi:hypothetical protein